MEISKLFNGIQLHSTVETEWGNNATLECQDPDSYTLNLSLKVKVPKPVTDFSKLESLNSFLPTLLPGLASMISTAKSSPFYENFYRTKVAFLQHNLPRLELLLSRHNFFDCETVLELQQPDTERRALFVQADMDVDMDGSDTDRVPLVDGSLLDYQPMTSYKWPKKTMVPNQFLASRVARLKQLELEASTKGVTNERRVELRSLISEEHYEVNQLKTQSFLIATTDPYIVLPLSLLAQDSLPFTPHIGDYCVVIYKDKLYPALIGDAGPRDKIGEASYRIAREINPKSNSNNRPMSDLKISYLIFPNSADKPFDAPDLVKIRTRCEALLNEIGGYTGELHVWENLIKPTPTPTPSPTPTPTLLPSPTTIQPSPSSVRLPFISPVPSSSVSPTPIP